MPTSMGAEKKLQQEAKDLLEWARQGKWDEVVERYKRNPNTHKVRITRSGDTALHKAVLDEKETIVEELVRWIDEAAAKNTKEKRNASAATKQGDDSAAKELGSTSAQKEQGSVSAAKEQGSASAAKEQGKGNASAVKAQGSASELEEASASAAKEQAKGNVSAETPMDHPLKIKNERGNTPLHLAAIIGNARMCYCIAQKHKDLVGAHNNLAETPLFLAALHGKKDAFLCLHKILENDKRYEYCRRNNGETILHCAIAGQYLDLAYQIIDKYGELANYFNEEGLTPLHLLASKPAVFRSGSHLGFFNKIIYHCMYVEKLKVRKVELPPLDSATSKDKKVDKKYPKNYQTCMNFLDVLTGAWNIITSSGKKENSEREQTTSQNQVKPNKQDPEDPAEGNQGNEAVDEDQLCPPNYYTCFDIVKFIYRTVMVVLQIGSRKIKKIQVMKEKHIWSAQIMKKLLECASPYDYDNSAGCDPQLQTEINKEDLTAAPIEENEQKDQKDQKTDGKRLTFNIKDIGYVFDVDLSKGGVTLATVQGNKQKGDKETPILIAAKNGITEMVMGILDCSPVAIRDKNAANKNIVLLAVENRQPEVYKLLLERKFLTDTLFYAVDNEGNSTLHLAATLSDYQPYPFAALQMQWEFKWYKYVKKSMPQHLFSGRNKANMTPKDMFRESHKHLVEKGGRWLSSTSTSCSVVATLITAVAFATTASVPGGLKENSSRPNLEKHPGFIVFAVSSLIGLSFSVTSVITFLVILTSRYHQKDFKRDLPRKLLLGLTSLFISLGAMLVCFCADHFFLLKDELKIGELIPLYAVACVPVIVFAIMRFPFYFDLIMATFKRVPQRTPSG